MKDFQGKTCHQSRITSFTCAVHQQSLVVPATKRNQIKSARPDCNFDSPQMTLFNSAFFLCSAHRSDAVESRKDRYAAAAVQGKTL